MFPMESCRQIHVLSRRVAYGEGGWRPAAGGATAWRGSWCPCGWLGGDGGSEEGAPGSDCWLLLLRQPLRPSIGTMETNLNVAA